MVIARLRQLQRYCILLLVHPKIRALSNCVLLPPHLDIRPLPVVLLPHPANSAHLFLEAVVLLLYLVVVFLGLKAVLLISNQHAVFYL